MQQWTATLNRLLGPFVEAMALPDTREIVVNRPGEFGVEGEKGWSWHKDERLTFDWLDAIGRLAARPQVFGPDNPTCSSRLPGGQRITMTRPPMAMPGTLMLDIRQRAQSFVPTLELFRGQGYFSFLDQGIDWVETLTRWVADDRLNIAITAPTGASKTTLAEALCRKIPEDERIVTLESAPELLLVQQNWIPLLYSQEDQKGNRSAEQALETALRQRPDRVIFGETRTGETWGLLRALNTGHRGCMVTTHANPGWDNMEDAFANQARQSRHAHGIPDSTIRDMIRKNIHVLICVEKKPGDPIPYRATMIERRV